MKEVLANQEAESCRGGGGTRVSAYFLAGPTASGKTDIAHLIAKSLGYDILSADSMLIYRGMDIGTAKPDQASRGEVRYHGLDLAEPDQIFTAGSYCEYAMKILSENAASGRKTIVVGGTGLYLKSILMGLESSEAPDPVRRLELESVYNTEGMPALLSILEKADSQALVSLKDKSNPRRVIRAIEIAESGGGRCDKWNQAAMPVIPCLSREVADLCGRIERRVAVMFSNGIIDEAAGLRKKYGQLSGTAMKAIGYSEAFSVIDGVMTEKEAVKKTVIRTRQLAKRQRTWFRHAQKTELIDISCSTEPAQAAAMVAEYWTKNGETICVPALAC